MKKFLAIAAATLPLLALAQSALDGSWRTDLKSISGADKPSKYLLKDGNYECDSCAPQIKVKADGTEQPVAGNPFLDALAVKVADDRTIELTTTKGGKVVTSGKITIAADGNSMTREFRTNDAKGFVNTSTTKMTRVGAPVKNAHVMSGSWKLSAVEKMTDNGVAYKTANGVLTMHSTDGSSYEAKLDGTKAVFKDSRGTDAVTVRMKDKNTLEETDWRGAKPWFVTTTTVGGDGKTANVVWENKSNNTRGSYKMSRQ
ncbi:MAG TPA: hypothetical protein VMZ74_16255 [Ramlibacter sp.]|nr:hypothetical protein [Ramlibacter sp.]